MSQTNTSKNSLMALLVGAVCVVVMVLGGMLVMNNSASNKTKECESIGKKYDEDRKQCREKTISERFSEECSSGIDVGGKHFACSDIRRSNLEKAYLDNTIVKHGDYIYEAGSSMEIAAGKNNGEYCLSASDSWLHIGETRCVVFSYEYMACSNGYCFLDEKQNYTSGFVAFFGKYNMYSWNNFRATYYNKSPVLVCGAIYSYQGHPEIKITNVSSQVVIQPTVSYSGGVAVYRYSCN